jgi:putative oxidoreductase
VILRRVARPLLASIFISGGLNALRAAEGHAQMAKPVLDKAIRSQSGSLPGSLPTDDVTLVKIDGAVKVAAGTALALGKLPRLSALLLLGSLVPTTLAGHRFWESEDAGEKQNQQIHFFKNAGLAGGLLLAAADTEGKPSVGWRARKAAKVGGKSAKLAGKQVYDTGEGALDGVRDAQMKTHKLAGRATKAVESAIPIPH